MNEALCIRRPEIFAICKRFKVKRLDTFDSGINGVEELGFLVDFLEYGPWHNVEAYYGVQRALEEHLPILHREITELFREYERR